MKNIKTFYEYSELLDDIAGLTTPEMAYIAGKEAKEAGIDLDDGIDIFMCQLEDDICDSDLTTQAGALCEELNLALGDADKILDEFIHMRAKIDVINLNMEQFFQAGYRGCLETGLRYVNKRSCRQCSLPAASFYSYKLH